MNNQSSFFHNTENFKKVPAIPRPHSVIYRRPKSTVKRRSIYPKLNNSQISIPSIANNTSMKNTHDSSFTMTNKLSSSLIDNKLRRNNSVQMKKMVTQYKNDFSLAMKKKETIEQKRIKSAMILGNKSREKMNEKTNEIDEVEQMKRQFKSLKKELLVQKELNQTIANDIKKNPISQLRGENENMYVKLKNLVVKYVNSVDINQETELKIQEMKSDAQLFKERHQIIQQLQSDVEVSMKKMSSIKSEIEKIKEEIILNENYIKKKTIENNNLKKQNEKILSEKKQRENYLFKKPVYEKKIIELSKKVDSYKLMSKTNEQAILKLQKDNSVLAIKNKEQQSHIMKPMNYSNIKEIEENPSNKINTKILLLKSLIRESKKRQDEFKDIIAHYDDYIQQKKSYEQIKEEEKEIEKDNKINTQSNDSKEEVQKEENKENLSSNYEKFEGLEQDNEVKKIEKTDNQDEKIKSKNNVQNEIDTPTLNPISFGEACSKKEKKIFKYLLRIMFAVNLINEKMAIETILKDFTSLPNDSIVNELTSRIFNEIKNENKNDQVLAQSIYEDCFNRKYKGDKSKFIESFMKFFGKIHLFTHEEECSLLEDFKKIYLPKYESIINKINENKNNDNYISFYQFKKILKSEEINRKDLLFNYVIYKMKHIQDPSISIFELSIDAFKEMFDSALSDRNQIINPGSSDSSVQMTEEEYKKIIENFLLSLSAALKEKGKTLREILKTNIKQELSKENNMKIDVVNIYKFFTILQEGIGFNIEDEIVKGCIFTQFQLDENEEDINLIEMENQIGKINN